MNINRENCEAWFLDFYEGRLTPEEAGALFAFLEENPDLRETFEGFENILLDDAPVIFNEKENLKRFLDLPKNINEANCEEFFIAHAEGLLDEEYLRQLDAFLKQYPNRRRDLELYAQTRLTADAITFEHKALLKKTAEPITAQNCEEFFIAAIEGLLAQDQLAELERFLNANPGQAKTFALFQQTRLAPDASIVFGDKESLKRRAGFRLQPVWRAAAAVVVLLVCGFGVYALLGTDPVSGDTFASKSKFGSRKVLAPDAQPGKEVAPDVNYASTQPGNNNGAPAQHNSVKNVAPAQTENIASRELALVQHTPRPETEAFVSAQEPVLASNTNSYREEEFPTLPQLAGRWAKRQLGVDNDPTVKAMSDSKEKMDGWDWAGVAVEKVSKGKAMFSNERNEEGRTFVFQAGKFRMKRTFKTKR